MGRDLLEVRLKPRASSDRIRRGEDGILEVAVTAPPVDGRANEHLVRLLADRTGVARSRISIVKGEHGRRKAVAVEGLTVEEIITRCTGRE